MSNSLLKFLALLWQAFFKLPASWALSAVLDNPAHYRPVFSMSSFAAASALRAAARGAGLPSPTPWVGDPFGGLFDNVLRPEVYQYILDQMAAGSEGPYRRHDCDEPAFWAARATGGRAWNLLSWNIPKCHVVCVCADGTVIDTNGHWLMAGITGDEVEQEKRLLDLFNTQWAGQDWTAAAPAVDPWRAA